VVKQLVTDSEIGGTVMSIRLFIDVWVRISTYRGKQALVLLKQGPGGEVRNEIIIAVRPLCGFIIDEILADDRYENYAASAEEVREHARTRWPGMTIEVTL
jgi:hypothetical protein